MLKQALEIITTEEKLGAALEEQSAVEDKKAKGCQNAGTELKPRIIAQSADGRPLCRREQAAPKIEKPAHLPWASWMLAMPSEVVRPWVKSVVRVAINQVTAQYRCAVSELPMSMVRRAILSFA